MATEMKVRFNDVTRFQEFMDYLKVKTPKVQVEDIPEEDAKALNWRFNYILKGSEEDIKIVQDRYDWLRSI